MHIYDDMCTSYMVPLPVCHLVIPFRHRSSLVPFLLACAQLSPVGKEDHSSQRCRYVCRNLPVMDNQQWIALDLRPITGTI